MKYAKKSIQNCGHIFILCSVIVLTFCMLCYPEATYQGACRGINTWATHLLPSLLPFFIAANLLMSLGFVQFLGILLDPIMRPIFRLPGEAGFALALGFTSGFPMGAMLTASLREQNSCTDEEASRLAAFTNNSSPLFLLIAVPVSMLHMPQLGILLLSAHYVANLIIGILLRFTAVKIDSTASQHHPIQRSVSIKQFLHTSKKQKQPFGMILGQAIQKGISGIVNIGGFVLFFSVTLAILESSGLLHLLNSLLKPVLHLLHISPQLSSAFSAGLFEMTLGAQIAAQSDADLLAQLMTISFILGWSGLSIQAQVCSILSTQHISAKRYCICRPLQGLLAAGLIPLFIKFCPWMISHPTVQTQSIIDTNMIISSVIALPLIFSLVMLGILLLLSFLIVILHRMHIS